MGGALGSTSLPPPPPCPHPSSSSLLHAVPPCRSHPAQRSILKKEPAAEPLGTPAAPTAHAERATAAPVQEPDAGTSSRGYTLMSGGPMTEGEGLLVCSGGKCAWGPACVRALRRASQPLPPPALAFPPPTHPLPNSASAPVGQARSQQQPTAVCFHPHPAIPTAIPTHPTHPTAPRPPPLPPAPAPLPP